MTDRYGRTIAITTSDGRTTYAVSTDGVLNFSVILPAEVPLAQALSTIEAMAPS